ncbi:DeoR/GlpR family DNA-binding transcription regulator [uncultured Cohaesibacter sp.]|uniref:DeoR/GlpR family DNA-binding transcription regulator n=1 Tax=uncultured Cohaesibacter sp. TaxID=1002546 RepID=UPI002930A70D|nr:DeoR/GlpR family DNA-binding transcription regulator [uncultured Cohaesibacter sp.]
MADLALNNPLVRQEILQQRLESGDQLVATDLAQEFDISLDTIRRDLLSLENQGLVRRVRGGAVPVRQVAVHFAEKRRKPALDCTAMVDAAIGRVEEGMTIIINGGTTLTYLAERLPPLADLFVITPSPAVAVALLEKQIATHLVGGRISPWGGFSVGSEAERSIRNFAADLAFPSICGLHPDFGLSLDDGDEAGVIRATLEAASVSVLIAAESKIGQRARHRVLLPDDITTIITDADEAAMRPFGTGGAEIIHV